MRFLIHFIAYALFLKKHEPKFLKYQGYEEKRVIRWFFKTPLPFFTKLKILEKIEMFDSIRIRTMIRDYINNHIDLFIGDKTFITSFGDAGKSGSVILYEFNHSNISNRINIINPWEIPKLPAGSNIIFVDDIIGTGKQSTTYINEQLNLILNPSHNIIIFALIVTEQGLNYTLSETNAEIYHVLMLKNDDHVAYSPECHFFSQQEKDNLQGLNKQLHSRRDYDQGLLISFFYSVPNNSMPILWKDKYRFKNTTWTALLPRKYGA